MHPPWIPATVSPYLCDVVLVNMKWLWGEGSAVIRIHQTCIYIYMYELSRQWINYVSPWCVSDILVLTAVLYMYIHINRYSVYIQGYDRRLGLYIDHTVAGVWRLTFSRDKSMSRGHQRQLRSGYPYIRLSVCDRLIEHGLGASCDRSSGSLVTSPTGDGVVNPLD